MSAEKTNNQPLHNEQSESIKKSLNEILRHPSAPPSLRQAALYALTDIDRLANGLQSLETDDDAHRAERIRLREMIPDAAPSELTDEAANELAAMLNKLIEDDDTPAHVVNTIGNAFDDMASCSPLSDASDWSSPRELKKVLVAHCNSEILSSDGRSSSESGEFEQIKPMLNRLALYLGHDQEQLKDLLSVINRFSKFEQVNEAADFADDCYRFLFTYTHEFDNAEREFRSTLE